MKDHNGNELLLVSIDPNGDENPAEYVPAYVLRSDVETMTPFEGWYEFQRLYIPDNATVQTFLELRLGEHDWSRAFVYDDVVIVGLEEAPVISRLTDAGFYFDRLPTYGRIV